MTTTHLTDMEKDGLEEVFKVLNMDFEEEKSFFSQFVHIFKKFFDNLF